MHLIDRALERLQLPLKMANAGGLSETPSSCMTTLFVAIISPKISVCT